MTDSSALEYFRKGRQALLEQKREIEQAIAQADRFLASLSGESPADLAAEPMPAGPRPNTIRWAIHQMLKLDPQPWSVARIKADLVRRNFPANDASVRSILNKMVHAKEIANPTRGMYQTLDVPAVAEGEAQAS
jgi:hypothetical protein